jgi:aspartyl-tRNA synthetase
MKLVELPFAKGKGFSVFDDSELVVGVCCPGIASYSNKKVKEIEAMAKSSVCAAKGMVYVKVNSLKEGALDLPSSVAKFYTNEDLAEWVCFI